MILSLFFRGFKEVAEINMPATAPNNQSVSWMKPQGLGKGKYDSFKVSFEI